LNRDLTYDAVTSIPDPITRALLDFALAQATLYFLRLDGESIEEYNKKLPDEPFDMAFFIRIMQRIFSHKRILQDILNGKIDENGF
jgi:hypothetical protein